MEPEVTRDGGGSREGGDKGGRREGSKVGRVWMDGRGGKGLPGKGLEVGRLWEARREKERKAL